MNDKLMSINQRIEDEKIMFNKLNEMAIRDVTDKPCFKNYIYLSNIGSIKLEEALKILSSMLVYRKSQPLEIVKNNDAIFVREGNV